jgi:anti-sigma B factor antagonist
MANNSPVISVAVVEDTAFVKLPPRANFASSVEFKTLVSELRLRSINHFVLDLGECVTMDSTFLGVLAGMVLRNADGSDPSDPSTAPSQKSEKLNLDLLNPNTRIAELLDNLGVVHLFNVIHQANPCTAIFEPMNDQPLPSKEEISRNCLEAHEILMRVNPDNIPKFKDVAAFLAEDLRKIKEQGK